MPWVPASAAGGGWVAWLGAAGGRRRPWGAPRCQRAAGRLRRVRHGGSSATPRRPAARGPGCQSQTAHGAATPALPRRPPSPPTPPTRAPFSLGGWPAPGEDSCGSRTTLPPLGLWLCDSAWVWQTARGGGAGCLRGGRAIRSGASQPTPAFPHSPPRLGGSGGGSGGMAYSTLVRLEARASYWPLPDIVSVWARSNWSGVAKHKNSVGCQDGSKI